MTEAEKKILQRIYNRVARHLLTMPRQAARDNGECLYRTKDGNRCAIGVLIPDNEYKPNWDRQVFDASKVTRLCPTLNDINAKFLDNTFKGLLEDLQMTHDHDSHWHSKGRANSLMYERLKNVANEYNLIPYQPDKRVSKRLGLV